MLSVTLIPSVTVERLFYGSRERLDVTEWRVSVCMRHVGDISVVRILSYSSFVM